MPESSEYERLTPVHDIPNFPILFIRDGDFVFMTDKHTGEIYQKLTTDEYCYLFGMFWEFNKDFYTYYTKGYFIPKEPPDTARDIKELHSLCSDKTRHRKGDDSFLLHFLWSEQCTLTETKLFKYLCDSVVLWNYSVVDQNDLHKAVGLKSKKHAGRVFKSLQDKGLIKLLHDRFDLGDSWKSLVKVHPKLFWKGRHSAWAVAVGESYEYVDAQTLD